MRSATAMLMVVCTVVVHATEKLKFWNLGNRIKLHTPASYIGWYGYWGKKLVLSLLLTAVCSLALATEPPWTGIWTFNGSLADSSGYGGDASAESPVYVPVVEGQALRLTDQSTVTIPDAPGLRLMGGFLLTCRVRFESLPGDAAVTVATKGDLAEGEYFLRVNSVSEGRRWAFFVNVGGWEPRVQSAAAVQTNVWYDIEAGWDGTNLRLTVNGNTTSVSRTGTPATTYEPVHLGGFDGDLDELRISCPAGCQTSKAYWPFEGNLFDASGKGHNLSGSPTAYEPGAVGQALQLGGGPFTAPSASDLQLAANIRIDCAVLFRELSVNAMPIMVKNDEYILRRNAQAEGGKLAFLVKLGGAWEPRVCADCVVETGKWYHVSARWDGFSSSLEVNGARTEISRAGTAAPGSAALTLGPFNGVLDTAYIENTGVVRLDTLTTDVTLLRAGTSAGLSGMVRNHGSAVSGCAVALSLPPGIVCETPATLDLGALSSGAERSVAWQIRANASTTTTATVTLTAAGALPRLTYKTLAFLPATDPDYSARSWNPPGGSGATHYVDGISGNNARAGTSPETAWRDFTPVSGLTLGPGDRLLIRRGSVLNQELSLSAHGTAQAWAEIGVYGQGARPVLRRNRDIDDRCALIINPDYLRIRGLTVCYAGKGLIVRYTESGHCGLLIEDCIAHHIEGVARMNAHGIPEWRDRNGAAGDTAGSCGFAVNGSLAQEVVLRDSEVFGCSRGIDVTGDNMTVDRVFCHDSYMHNTSANPALCSVRRAYLRNSIFDAAGWHAYSGTMNLMLVNMCGLVIRNCHFLNQPDSGSWDEGGIDFEAGGEGCLIDGCTFRNNSGAAIETLGLSSPQARNVEIAGSRFDRDNVMLKHGPSEIFIWGGSTDPEICCSSGLIRDNGYALVPGVRFFTNQAPTLTQWTLANNTQYATSAALDAALPLNNPPAVSAGGERWTDYPSVTLAGTVSDDGKPLSGQLTTTWELLDGPGTVTFLNASSAATIATFTAAGDYTLRLKADDGELWRSGRTAVHILPPGMTVAKAWTFATPLDKEGWTDWNPGTQDETFTYDGSTYISRPVRLVEVGEYVVAIKDASDAYLLSPDALGLDLNASGLVAIRFQNHTPAVSMRLRFTTTDSPSWEANLGRIFPVTPNDTETRLCLVDMRGTEGWCGTLKQLRLDFSDGSPLTGTCRIDYVWVGRGDPPAQSWWRFDETSGPALDSLAGIHSSPVSGAFRAPGKGRYAFSFDGTDDYVGFSTNLAHLAGALTVSAWVKPNRPPSDVTPYDNKGRVIANTFNYGAKRGWLLGCPYDPVDKLQLLVYSPAGGSYASVTCNNFFRDWSNKWVHVAGVFKPAVSGSDGYLALYTNGVLAATPVATAFAAIGTTNTYFKIGMRSDSTSQGMWSGLIDEVRVIGAALPQADIGALMPVAEGHWRFDETDGLNKAYDSVNANTGSVSYATYTNSGKVVRALSFTGTASRVSFSTNLAHITGALTASAWVKPDEPPIVGGLGRVIAGTYKYAASSQSRGWLLGNEIGPSDSITFKIHSPGGAIAAATLPGFFAGYSNRWAHVAGVFRPGESVGLYVNGILVTNVPTAITVIGYTNTSLRVGMRADNTAQGIWSGLIDEVRVYDGALAPGALVAECAAAPNLPPENILFAASPATCREDETVVLEAAASDPDGDDGIARVEFYAGPFLIATCPRAPYRFEWKSHSAGAYPVTARIYDTHGGISVSPSVTVTLRSLIEACAAGHWRFDFPPDSENTAQDSVADNNGTLGGGNANFKPARVPGKFNGALSFDGTNDYVGFGTNLAHLAGALTVAAWVKPNRPPSNLTPNDNKGRVIANTFNYDAKRGWLLGCPYDSVDKLQFLVYSPAGGSYASVTCNNFFRDWSNKWVHVAGVFKPAVSGSDGYLALYTNGVLAVTPAINAFAAIGTTNTNFKIGMRSDSTSQGMWSGVIDEVRVFGAALPQDELDALCALPAGEWRFEELSTCATASNNLANLFHGTVYKPALRTSSGYGGSRAILFDDSTNRVSFTTNMAHLAGALTVSAWVKPDKPPVVGGVGRVIASTYNYGASRGWLLGNEFGPSDTLTFKILTPSGGASAATSANFFRDWSNQWVHVAGVFKPGEYVALYTNGTLAASNATAYTVIGYTTTNLRIGLRADNTTQGLWSGLIDEVRLYEGALPLFAVQALSANAPVNLPGILNAPVGPDEPLAARRATILLVR